MSGQCWSRSPFRCSTGNCIRGHHFCHIFFFIYLLPPASAKLASVSMAVTVTRYLRATRNSWLPIKVCDHLNNHNYTFCANFQYSESKIHYIVYQELIYWFYVYKYHKRIQSCKPHPHGLHCCLSNHIWEFLTATKRLLVANVHLVGH